MNASGNIFKIREYWGGEIQHRGPHRVTFKANTCRIQNKSSNEQNERSCQPENLMCEHGKSAFSGTEIYNITTVKEGCRKIK